MAILFNQSGAHQFSTVVYIEMTPIIIFCLLSDTKSFYKMTCATAWLASSAVGVPKNTACNSSGTTNLTFNFFG